MHSTNDVEDTYLGSGIRVKRSIKKYGFENHTREILEFFDTRELLECREKEVVTQELLSDPNCLNLKIGGEGGGQHGTVNVKDASGKGFRVRKDDPRFLSRELVGVNSGKSVNKGLSVPRSLEARIAIRNATIKRHGKNPSSCRMIKDGIEIRINIKNIQTQLDLGWKLKYEEDIQWVVQCH